MKNLKNWHLLCSVCSQHTSNVAGKNATMCMNPKIYFHIMAPFGSDSQEFSRFYGTTMQLNCIVCVRLHSMRMQTFQCITECINKCVAFLIRPN